ncbi:MAG: hypothetical protein Q7T89_04695, partial [Anaerolineales bacterium]|nr:hypothetical protein [Anaerolineales bacterium]
YVYNTILPYFATRPDKLFVVITAPPVSGVKGWWYSENARAFNQWLVNDWLRENNYTLNNVVVFDFYNILTDPNAHHRVNNGEIEHVIGTSNTLYYPSGDKDDHPSVDGSLKATEEFAPMLNVFYHRWKENAPLQPAPEPDVTAQAESQPEPPAAASGSVDNFDSGLIWEAFRDESTSTSMACAAEPGTGRSGNSLKLDFNIAPNSWGTCAHMYETTQDWSAGNGLVFYFRAAQAGTLFDIDLYAGPPENRETYLYTIEAPAESVSSWIPMELRWEDFRRASWEENADAPFAKADQVTGMAFGLGTAPDAPNISTVWVDDISLLGTAVVSAPEQPVPAEQPQKPSLPCVGALVLPFAIALLPIWKKIKK